MLTPYLVALVGLLVGVAGLIYGLWQRSVAVTAKGEASAISKELEQEKLNHQDSVNRYEALVTNMRNEILAIQKELNNAVPVSALADRFNAVCSWRVPPRPTDPKPASPGVRNSSTPGDAPGSG